MQASLPQFGAVRALDGLTTFTLWAPNATGVAVEIGGETVLLEPQKLGFWQTTRRCDPGARYWFLVNGEWRIADPCSRSQPNGSDGESQVIDVPALIGPADSPGLDASPDLVIYELHVGTYTPEGTFSAIVPHLHRLRDLGVTAVELMPIGTFPGDRNWGYDTVHPFAPHHAYGGPAGLAELISAAHELGVAVIVDVVYNHLGPGSEVLSRLGPYFSAEHFTPWGAGLNLDGPLSDAVREYVIQNALLWLEEYGADGLRVDAAHNLFDSSPVPIVCELAERARARCDHSVLLIAEHNRNDPRVVRGAATGGACFDAQWAQDYHSAFHAVTTAERSGRYADFGSGTQLAAAYGSPFVLTGQYSRYRRRRHGAPVGGTPASRFVAFVQNHDHVGNRPDGRRPSPAVRELAALCLCFVPYIPMLFMGEEFGADTPFYFFTDYDDAELAERVRRDRNREVDADLPNPQSYDTFAACRLRHEAQDDGLRWLYRAAIALRPRLPPVSNTSFDPSRGLLDVTRGPYRLVANFSHERRDVAMGTSQPLLATTGANASGGHLDLDRLSAAILEAAETGT